jgi:alpha-glucosidase
MRRRILPLALALLTLSSFVPNVGLALEFHVASPSNAIEARVTFDDSRGTLAYRVLLATRLLVRPSQLGLVTRGADLTQGLEFAGESRELVREEYALPSGKSRHHSFVGNELRLTFKKGRYELATIIRVSDDGFAVRYQVEGPVGNAVLSESTELALAPDSETWSMPYLPPYNYELTYDRHLLEAIDGARALPFLARDPGGTWMLALEAGLDSSFSGSHLSARGAGRLGLDFAPEDRARGYVEIGARFASPWRALTIASDLGALFASSLATDLGGPSASQDASWIRPGRSAWSWMAGWGKESLELAKVFVDLAAEMGWEYYLADEGWRPSWVPALAQYAQDKGVGILLWEHQKNLDTQEKIDRAFALWSAWGVRGLKIDFFDSEDQAHLAIYDRILASAAHWRFILNFHGATPKILSQRRKWPHLLTVEGVRGEEYRQWDDGGPRAEHDTTLPFTRNVLGAQDSTLAPFGFAHAESHAYLLALSVIFESGLAHFAEGPDDYLKSPARDFLSAVPVAWDESRLLDGFPGEYAAIARRRGQEWFIGAISKRSRTFTLPLTFLPPGRGYQAELYLEGAKRWEIVREDRAVSAGEALTLPVAASSGAALRIR